MRGVLHATRAVVIAVVALGLLVAACADDDDDSMSDAPSPTSGREVHSTSTPDPDDRATTTSSGSAMHTTTTADPGEFRSAVEPVDAAALGASWTAGIGCAPPEDLATVIVTHRGFDGSVHEGRIIVAADLADSVVSIFATLFDADFPIERMEPVSAYGGDDDASMRANNTSGYNCRTIAGTDRLSQHAIGMAIDVNPLVNPWVHDGLVDPPEGAAYADRSRTEPGMIHADDVVVEAFAAHGWSWGGYWSEPDYQHFSTTGR